MKQALQSTLPKGVLRALTERSSPPCNAKTRAREGQKAARRQEQDKRRRRRRRGGTERSQEEKGDKAWTQSPATEVRGAASECGQLFF